MTSTTETKRLQTDRDRAVRRRLRAGVLRLGGFLGWDRQKVVRFSEVTGVNPGVGATGPRCCRSWGHSLKLRPVSGRQAT